MKPGDLVEPVGEADVREREHGWDDRVPEGNVFGAVVDVLVVEHAEGVAELVDLEGPERDLDVLVLIGGRTRNQSVEAAGAAFTTIATTRLR